MHARKRVKGQNKKWFSVCLTGDYVWKDHYRQKCIYIIIIIFKICKCFLFVYYQAFIYVFAVAAAILGYFLFDILVQFFFFYCFLNKQAFKKHWNSTFSSRKCYCYLHIYCSINNWKNSFVNIIWMVFIFIERPSFLLFFVRIIFISSSFSEPYRSFFSGKIRIEYCWPKWFCHLIHPLTLNISYMRQGAWECVLSPYKR